MLNSIKEKLLTEKYAERTTLVLPIVGLDIGTISSGSSIVLRFRLDEYSPALVLIIYLYQKDRQQFRRTDFKFPTIGNTRLVGCHVKATMKLLLTSTILILHLFTFGQTKSKPDVYDLPIPKTLEECFKLLDKTLPDDEIHLVKTLQEDSIYFNPAFQYRADFFHAWKIYNGSRLTEYFNKKGLQGSFEIYEAILISYHRYLNNDSIRLDEQIRKYQYKQQKDYEHYISKTEKDSLNNIYIPKDLQDCFIQLDKILPEKDRTEIKNLKSRAETIKYHHGLGMWLRNNWGLWGGSRLQKYFFDKKVNHPDNMSSVILEFYYDWLNNNNEGWQKWTQ